MQYSVPPDFIHLTTPSYLARSGWHSVCTQFDQSFTYYHCQDVNQWPSPSFSLVLRLWHIQFVLTINIYSLLPPTLSSSFFHLGDIYLATWGLYFIQGAHIRTLILQPAHSLTHPSFSSTSLVISKPFLSIKNSCMNLQTNLHSHPMWTQ